MNELNNKITQKYLELIDLIKQSYEKENNVKINSYDKEYLLENDLVDFLDSIYFYLSEADKEEI